MPRACEPRTRNRRLRTERQELSLRTAWSTRIGIHRLGVDDDPSVIGNESFDVAIATGVIEHVVKPLNLPRFAKQLLRPGGHLIISTPCHGYLKNLILALANSGTRISAHSGMVATSSSGRTGHCPNC